MTPVLCPFLATISVGSVEMERTAEIGGILRRWPRNVLSDHRALARECAELCLELFNATRVLIAFELSDEPWSTIALLDESGFTWREEQPIDVATSVAVELSDLTFYADEPVRNRTAVRIAGQSEAVWVKQPFEAALRDALGEVPILSTPLVSENVAGRVFICAPIEPSNTELSVAEVVGVVMGTRFEATLHVQNAVRQAVDQDRIRIARDLHDGLLQSFTGVVLQLETIHSTLDKDAEARRMITDAQGIIMADQRDLRRFVEHLRPRPARREPVFDFQARLEELRTRFATQWGIKITIDVARIDPLVSALLGEETFRLIHEAVTNSAKHGSATNVRVGVRTAASEMLIDVTDDGVGFPFRGRLTMEEMRERGTGPSVLAERVHSLNGDLSVESTEAGATLHISVPLGWGRA
jgi:signal transduction histidine kinase